MEVANEAAAPEPPQMAAPPEGDATSAAPSPSTAPASASPEPPVTPSEVAAEARLFQRPTLRAVLAPTFWAGLLGAGAGCWFLGTIGAFAAAGITRRPDPEIHIALAFTAALVVVLARGFRAPLQSYAGLAGRLFGSFVFGSLWTSLAVMIVALIDAVERLHDLGSFVVVALLGALMSCLALARLYGIGAERPRRIQIAASTAAVLFMCGWPVMPGLRCQLGFSQGCRAAASRAFRRATCARPARSAPRAARERTDSRAASPGASTRARARRGTSASPRSTSARAARSATRRRASVHVIELERRCDRYGAFACAELGRAYQGGQGVEANVALAARLYRKACLLGADDGCQRASQYR